MLTGREGGKEERKEAGRNEGSRKWEKKRREGGEREKKRRELREERMTTLPTNNITAHPYSDISLTRAKSTLLLTFRTSSLTYSCSK